jgi:hypothetical protein
VGIERGAVRPVAKFIDDHDTARSAPQSLPLTFALFAPARISRASELNSDPDIEISEIREGSVLLFRWRASDSWRRVDRPSECPRRFETFAPFSVCKIQEYAKPNARSLCSVLLIWPEISGQTDTNFCRSTFFKLAVLTKVTPIVQS